VLNADRVELAGIEAEQPRDGGRDLGGLDRPGHRAPGADVMLDVSADLTTFNQNTHAGR
jgi:hypothetical protein